jgi:hypothetical protein
MKSYVKTYLTYFGYDKSSWIACEFCGATAVDLHHLEPRSIAKSKLNLIDNIVALCRECHIRAEHDKAFNNEVKLIHRKKLLGVKTDFETKRYL